MRANRQIWILALLLLQPCFLAHSAADDHESVRKDKAGSETLKQRLIERLALSSAHFEPSPFVKDPKHCVVTRQLRDLSNEKWKKVVDESTKRINDLYSKSPQDLKKLEELAEVLEKYAPLFLSSFVYNDLDHDSLDYLYRLWVKFELYPTPEKATDVEKARIQEKNRKLTYAVTKNIETYYYIPMEELSHRFDAFYQTQTGKPLSEEFRAKGLTERSAGYKKATDNVSLSSSYKIPGELVHKMSMQSPNDVPLCDRNDSHGWATLGEKANLLFQLAQAGYGIPDPLKAATATNSPKAGAAEQMQAFLAKAAGNCKDGNCSLPTTLGNKDPKKPEAAAVSIPEKYFMDYINRAMERVREEAAPLEKIYAYKGPNPRDHQLEPTELKKLNELRDSIAQYQKALEPFYQRRVTLGQAALEKAKEIANDKRRRDEKEKALHPHGNKHAKKEEPATEPIYLAPIDDNDTHMGKNADLGKVDLEKFAKDLSNHDETSNSRLLSYQQHIKAEEAKLREQLAANNEDAERRDANAIQYALEKLGSDVASCALDGAFAKFGSLQTATEQKAARSTLENFSDQKLLDYSFKLETGDSKNTQLLSLVREEIACRLGHSGAAEIDGRTCAVARGYFFKLNSFNEFEAAREIPVVATNGQIQWKQIFSEDGHHVPLLGTALFERVYRNSVNLMTAPTASFEDPESWWFMAGKIPPSSWEYRKKEMGCAEFALVKHQLERMGKLAVSEKHKTFLADRKTKSAKERKDLEKQITEKIKGLDGVKAAVAKEIAARGSMYEPLPGGRNLAGAETSQLLDILALRPNSPFQAELAARALSLPPHLWAHRQMLSEIVEKESKSLDKKDLKHIQEDLIGAIDKITPEELAKEWLWYNSQNHTYRTPKSHEKAKEAKPGWFSSWFTQEKLKAQDITHNGTLELMGLNRIKEIEKQRERNAPNGGISKDAVVENHPFKEFITKAETAPDDETLTRMLASPLHHVDKDSIALGGARDQILEDLKEQLGARKNVIGIDFDFNKAAQAVFSGDDKQATRRLLATLHVLQSLDKAMVTASFGGDGVSAYKEEDVETQFADTLSNHGEKTPQEALARYALAITSELTLREKNNRASTEEGFYYLDGKLRAGKFTGSKRGEFHRAFDEIADPNRDKRKIEHGSSADWGLYRIEQKVGALPTEARLKVFALNPFVKTMLGMFVRPEEDMQKQYTCPPPLGGKTSSKDTLANFKDAKGPAVLKEHKDQRAYLQRLFFENSPSLIAEATMSNLYQLQHFLGEIENADEMKELEKLGIDKRTIFGILCEGNVTNPKIAAAKQMLAEAIETIAKTVTVTTPGEAGKPATETLDRKKPGYRTLQLASALLGSLESFGSHDLSPQTRRFAGDGMRFSPEYTKVLKAEKAAIAEAEKNPALQPRRELVQRIESYLHGLGTPLSPNSRMALLTPLDASGGTTDGNLEGLIAAFDHLQSSTASPEDKAKNARQMRDLFLTPNPISIATYLKHNQPRLLDQMRNLDSATNLRKPLIEELLKTGTFSEEAQKKLYALAQTRYNEKFKDSIALMEQTPEKLNAHAQKEVPLIARDLALELQKEAALQEYDKILRAAAKKTGKPYPPATPEAQYELAVAGSGEAVKNKAFVAILNDIANAHGTSTQGVPTLESMYAMLGHTNFLQRKIHQDLDTVADGHALPACLRDKAVSEAFGSLSQGVAGALSDIANGRFRNISPDGLQTLLSATRDLSTIDRGEIANSPYISTILENRIREGTQAKFNSKIRTNFLERELQDVETRLAHAVNLLAQVKHSELGESGGVIGWMGGVPAIEKKAIVAQYQKEKETWENSIRSLKAQIERIGSEGKDLDGLSGDNANRRVEKENADFGNEKGQGQASKRGLWEDVYGEDVNTSRTQTWAKLYTKYCLPKEEWNDRYALAMDNQRQGEQTIVERNQQLAVLEALSKRQSLVEKGRRIGEDLPLPDKRYVETLAPGAHIKAYLDKHPNKGIIKNWIAEATQLGMSEASAKQMMDKWLREGELMASTRKAKEVELIGQINKIRTIDPETKKPVPVLKWDGQNWEVTNPLHLQAMKPEEKTRLSNLLTQFQAAHPGAKHALKDFNDYLGIQHSNQNFSPFFVVDDNVIARAIHSDEDKQHGGTGFKYELLPAEKIQNEMTAHLAKINKLFREVHDAQTTIEQCLGNVVDKVLCSRGVIGLLFWESPIGRAIKRKQDILMGELPAAISALKNYGDIHITKDPTGAYSKMPAIVAASDLMLKTLKMGEESLVELQKTTKNLDWVAVEGGADAASILLTGGVNSYFAAVSKATPWISRTRQSYEIGKTASWAARAAKQYATGVEASVFLHNFGQGLSWGVNNGMGLGWQAYYKYDYWKNKDAWDKQIADGGGSDKIRMADLTDTDGNHIPDIIETGNWQFAKGEDPKSSALGLLKSALTVFGPSHVLNELQWSRAILPKVLQHPINFGVAEFGSTYLWAPAMQPDATSGELFQEAGISFLRGTAYGIPYWQLASKSKYLDGAMSKSWRMGDILKKVPGLGNEKVLEKLSKIPLIGGLGRTAQTTIAQNPSIGPALAQFAGLEGIDVAMYTALDYPKVKEENPGLGGYLTGLGSHLGQGLAMNLWFLKGTGQQYDHHKTQQEYHKQLEKITKGEATSIDHLIKTEVFKDKPELQERWDTDPELAQFRAETYQRVMMSLMELPASQVYEMAKALQANAKNAKTHATDLDYMAEYLGIPTERVVDTLKEIANSTIPGGVKIPALQSAAGKLFPTIGKYLPSKNGAPLSEMNSQAQVLEIASRQAKADYEKGTKDGSPEMDLKAKRQLARDVSKMGPSALKYFDINKLGQSLKFTGGSETAYEKTIADAMGRALNAEGWQFMKSSRDVKGLDSQLISEFASDLVGGEKDFRLTYLTWRRALNEPKILEDIVLGGRLKSGIPKAIRLFGADRVVMAITRAEHEANAMTEPTAKQAALDKLKPFIQVREGLKDAADFGYFRESVKAGSTDPKDSAGETQVQNQMLTQRPQSIGYVGIRTLDPDKVTDQQMLTDYAKLANIDPRMLVKAVRRHKKTATDKVDSLAELVAFEKTKNRL